MTTLAKEQAILSGITPLEYMLKIMRDETQSPTFRADMAKAAAPYVHPRLATIEHNGKDGGPIQYNGNITVSPDEAYLRMVRGK